MTVNSIGFLLFFMILIFLYYLPVLRKYQWFVLLCASYLFLVSFGIKPIIYIIATTVSTYFAARWVSSILDEQNSFLKKEKGNLSKAEVKEYKEKNKKKRNKVVIFEVLFNIGILIVLKYTNFFILNINSILSKSNQSMQFDLVSFIIPLGISYYTLQSIGYVIDVSKGKVEFEKNFLKTALFVSYFPQITQGPIGRFGDLAPQLFSSHAFSYQNLSYGCQRVLWGFFKKTVIADRLKPMVDNIFNNYDQYSGMTILLGCIYFSFQLYADFSGYMDIVGGYSEILGIKIAENFRRPFFSQSLAEYWRRWHITLGGWFRDYVFYPLSLSKTAANLGRTGRKHLPIKIAKLIPSVYALFIVWFCTGFWHDASWRYILWGVFNGIIIISSTLLESEYNTFKKILHISEENKAWQIFRMFRTFLIVCFLKVFPCANSTHDSLQMLKRIFTQFQFQLTRNAWIPELKISYAIYIAFGLIIFFIVSLIQERISVREWLEKKPFAIRWFLYFMLIFSVLSFGVLVSDMAGGFEYAQF